MVEIPANSLAEEMGSPRSANMIMLGAFTRKSNLVSLDSLLDGLKDALKGKTKLISINSEALKAGYKLL